MKPWVDAQLPPAIAAWISAQFSVECEHIRGTELAQADDGTIFTQLRNPGAVIVTKDEDFVDLVTRLGCPPHIVWVRVGNVTNGALREFFAVAMPNALELLAAGLVELSRKR